ncbi:SDR family NAD(P)-dependent oxidoreductase [Bradyrhizobium sp. USDA 329]|jgi:3-oxoacyl-[acyl-carrier protein] reductase|uniref:SDR family NAD(P)-dependent oxidoreductase n=1 Tax=unclassified Bradyrhizobium TaxID=2631580 RepID=UPI0035162789
MPQGAHVVRVARRSDLPAELAQEVCGELITPFEQDVMAEVAAENTAALALREFGHVDIFVNNDGGSRPLALAFTGYGRIAHALLPRMIERKRGRIVSIGIHSAGETHAVPALAPDLTV